MFFRQILHDDLGCASYVVADGGEAAVIDPQWDVEPYLRLAEDQGFRIAHILETHNHADHVSGRGRLAEATGARIHVPNADDVAFDGEAVADGSAVTVGSVRIRALATPGHRPEHTSYVVEDASRSESAWLVLTGDSLFVGDIARPDLAVEAEDGARDLYRSLRRLLELPEYAEVWPGHIGGSLCGGAGMSEKPGSTIGFERNFNRLLKLSSEEDFVRELTGRRAPQPPNFRRIVELNRGPLLRHAAAIDGLAPERVRELLAEGATTGLDGRATREFDGAHVPGSINVTMVKAAVGTRAAWVVDPESDVVVAAASDAEARRMARMLEAVGFRSLRGYLAGGAAGWEQAGLELATTEAIDPAELARRLARDEVILLDVRERVEWDEGHVAGSIFVPYHELRHGIPDELQDADRPVAVACSAGNRSSLAASLLLRAGAAFKVVHVTDGGVADLALHGVELAEPARI